MACLPNCDHLCDTWWLLPFTKYLRIIIYYNAARCLGKQSKKKKDKQAHDTFSTWFCFKKTSYLKNFT